METAEIIGIDTSLFSAIDIIAEHDYVLVRDNDQTIKGIVTASDLSQQFRQLAEPFLLIGEIENYVRRLIHGKFTLDELRDVRGDDVQNRPVEGVTDLTFGEYVGLLENDARWKKLGLVIDRASFVERLDAVRVIRNDVVHFDPDGLIEADLKTLRDFSQFLQKLKNIGVV